MNEKSVNKVSDERQKFTSTSAGICLRVYTATSQRLNTLLFSVDRISFGRARF